jgi:hypothetical protein
MANPTVMVIHHLGEKSIQTNRDSSDVLRHIIKNVSERLVRTIESRASLTFFFENLFSRERKESFFEEMEEIDGERAVGSDTAEGTEERAIRAMPIVTTLSCVRAVKDKERGVRVTLTCYNCREYGSCAQPEETPIHLSKERTTMRA